VLTTTFNVAPTLFKFVLIHFKPVHLSFHKVETSPLLKKKASNDLSPILALIKCSNASLERKHWLWHFLSEEMFVLWAIYLSDYSQLFVTVWRIVFNFLSSRSNWEMNQLERVIHKWRKLNKYLSLFWVYIAMWSVPQECKLQNKWIFSMLSALWSIHTDLVSMIPH